MTNNNYNINREKIGDYLSLFGLREDFTLEELNTSYRVLAKLNHPDLNKDPNSQQRMTSINEVYHFLKEAYVKGELEYLHDIKRKEQDRDSKAEDIFYNQYKKGFLILKSAFEDYFGETEDKSAVENDEVLKRELLRAKIEFATLINDLPYNQWVNDAIDKINSINKWLD